VSKGIPNAFPGTKFVLWTMMQTTVCCTVEMQFIYNIASILDVQVCSNVPPHIACLSTKFAMDMKTVSMAKMRPPALYLYCVKACSAVSLASVSVKSISVMVYNNVHKLMMRNFVMLDNVLQIVLVSGHLSTVLLLD